MDKSKLKSEKAITLIALVVTIVVLIILAGVAINVTLGENGIINKAREAKRKQLEAEYKEKIGTELLAAQVDAIARNEELEDEQIKDIISNYGELQDDGDTIKIKDKDIQLSLSDIYTGTTTTSGSYTENKAKIALLESQVKRLQEQLENSKLSGDEKDAKILDLNNKITELENNLSSLKLKVVTAIKKVGGKVTMDSTDDEIAKAIESLQEIISTDTLAKGSSWSFSKVGENEFTCEYEGVYLIELNGAQGGAIGGKGTYTKAYVFLNKGDKLNITVGGYDGTNGGGTASSNGNNGGGATSAYLGNIELLTAGGGAGYSYKTNRTWQSNHDTSGNRYYTTNDTGNIKTETIGTTPTSNGVLKNGTNGTTSDTGDVVTWSKSEKYTKPEADGYGNIVGTYSGTLTTTYYKRDVIINGGGGGGHFGGIAGSAGTSYINTSKCFNYDTNTYKKSNIEYTGTNGGNDFVSSNVTYNTRSSDGGAQITYLSFRIDQ